MLFIQLGIWGAWGIFGLVNEDSFDGISEKFKSGMYFTRGLYGKKGKGRALFITDPDGNEKGKILVSCMENPQGFNLNYIKT